MLWQVNGKPVRCEFVSPSFLLALLDTFKVHPTLYLMLDDMVMSKYAQFYFPGEFSELNGRTEAHCPNLSPLGDHVLKD